MYLSAHCPHCGKFIRKIGPAVLKPGVVSCPTCKELSSVSGMLPGIIAYVLCWLVFAGILSALKKFRINHQDYLFIFGFMYLWSGYLMSLFFGLKK